MRFDVLVCIAFVKNYDVWVGLMMLSTHDNVMWCLLPANFELYTFHVDILTYVTDYVHGHLLWEPENIFDDMFR